MERRELLATYPVTSVADAGAGSLRAAIVAADGDGQSLQDTISFDIAGTGVQTIRLLSPLPAITHPVSIDGTTQPGYAGQPLVQLDGTGAGTGGDGLTLAVGSGGSTIRGLEIGGFAAAAAAGGGGGGGGDGILIDVPVQSSPAVFVSLQDTISGNTIVGNGGAGVALSNAQGNPIGQLSIVGNSIYANGKLGIDLANSGVPVPPRLFLTSAATSNGQATFAGTFQGDANRPYVVEFYASDVPDPSGYGQGQYDLGTATVTTDGVGLATFSQSFANPHANAISYSATLTDRIGISTFMANNNTSEFTLDVPRPQGTPTADLVVTGTATVGPLAAGEPITVTLTVANNGQAAAGNVVLHDALPSSSQPNATITTSAGTASIAGSFATGNLGTIAPGASVTVTISGASAGGTTFTNTAGVFGTTAESNYADNESTQTVAIQPTDLGLTEAATPNPLMLGGNATFTVTVTNQGPAAATNVTISNILPAGLNLVSVTPSQGAAATVTGGSNISDNLGTLAVGASATLTIIAAPTATGSYTNVVGVASDLPPVNPSGGTATATINVVPATTPPVGSVDLAITQSSSPTPASVNNYLFFTLKVTNNGTLAATNVTVIDTLPLGVTLANVAPSQGGYATFDGSKITDNLGSLAPGASATIVVVVTPTTVGELTNPTAVSADQADANNADNQSTLSVDVATTSLILTQSILPTIGTTGQTQLFTLQVTNTGSTAATGVTLVDALPAGTTFVQANNIGGLVTLSGGVITDTLGTLQSGATATLVLVLVPKAPGSLLNYAALVADGSTPIYSRVTLAVPAGPSVLGVVRSADNSLVSVNFDQPLDTRRAGNPANFKLYDLGLTARSLSTKIVKFIKINAATYVPQTEGVVLTPARKLDPTHYYTLIVVGATNSGISNGSNNTVGITNTAGGKLIGQPNKGPGTNYSTTFPLQGLPTA